MFYEKENGIGGCAEIIPSSGAKKAALAPLFAMPSPVT